MMKFLNTLVLSTAVLAQTYTEFSPATTNPLVVEFVGDASGSQFVSTAQNLPAERVSVAPFVGLAGEGHSGSHVLMMVDTDALINGTTKSTILHYFQTDVSPNSPQANYTRFTAPTDIPAVYNYLAPGPPAGQIHRYTLMLFIQPANLTKDVVDTAFKSSFPAGSPERVGFSIKTFQSMAGIADPVAATYFEFGEGALTEGEEMKVETGNLVTKHRGFRGDGDKKWVEWSVVALGLGLGGLLMVV